MKKLTHEDLFKRRINNSLDLFAMGMMRQVDDIISDVDSGIVLNLGPGMKKIYGSVDLEYPEWNADYNDIPFEDESVSQIHAYHFLEHVNDIIYVMQECQRVLKTGGHMNIVVPYYKSQIAYHDFDHKNFFTEVTFEQMFTTDYYLKNKIGWKFDIGFNLICGIVERNMCLMTQLIKR